MTAYGHVVLPCMKCLCMLLLTPLHHACRCIHAIAVIQLEPFPNAERQLIPWLFPMNQHIVKLLLSIASSQSALWWYVASSPVCFYQACSMYVVAATQDVGMKVVATWPRHHVCLGATSHFAQLLQTEQGWSYNDLAIC